MAATAKCKAKYWTYLCRQKLLTKQTDTEEDKTDMVQLLTD